MHAFPSGLYFCASSGIFPDQPAPYRGQPVTDSHRAPACTVLTYFRLVLPLGLEAYKAWMGAYLLHQRSYSQCLAQGLAYRRYPLIHVIPSFTK